MNNPALGANRVLSIDVFRGIIIFTMVFVNELAGISNIPVWMKYLPADVDGMTFVDLVFPAFLFIVGMSIPFAVQARANKGDSALEIFKHIVLRSFGLMVIGVFMVNTEYGYDAAAMSISMPLWTLLMFISVLLIWSNYPRTISANIALGAKLIGVAGLVTLWWLYKGPNDTGMTTQWWGILGLIGWAYLIAGFLFLLTRQCASPATQFFTLAISALALIAIFFAMDAVKADFTKGLFMTKFFEPSATNPLLVYILPYIILALCGIFGFSLRPEMFNAGGLGILWSLFFACVIMGIGALLTRIGLRVKL